MPAQPIVALTYADGDKADNAMRYIAERLTSEGWRLAGLVQHNRRRPERARCDMLLEELASGELIAISEDRGPNARGCALKIDELLRASELLQAAFRDGPDLVILNKFGKAESEGGGLRPAIAKAIEADASILIAVPYRNLENWRAFVGDMAIEVALDDDLDPLSSVFEALGAPQPTGKGDWSRMIDNACQARAQQPT